MGQPLSSVLIHEKRQRLRQPYGLEISRVIGLSGPQTRSLTGRRPIKSLVIFLIRFPHVID